MTRAPAEWERHERTIMGWPCRRELWGPTLDYARADYAAVANAIAQFEPVAMIANAGEDSELARRACTGAVEIVTLPLDDSWLRDCGPIYVYQDDGRRLAVHFRFNAWGEKFDPYDHDAAIGGLIAQRLGDDIKPAPLVLEGGSILTDGTGTLLTTEQCLLHPSRNPTLSQPQIEHQLRVHLGVTRFVWLGRGLLEDRDTDGHVDLIAALVPDESAMTVLLQQVPPGNPNYEHCQENRRRAEAAGLQVIDLPFLPYVEVNGETVAASYLNFYICNDAVIVPVCDAETDPEALAIIANAYPERQVVPVPGAVLAYGGGGPHCITQQVPVRKDTADA